MTLLRSILCVCIGFAVCGLFALASEETARAQAVGSTSEARDHLAKAKRAAATGNWVQAAQEYEQANSLEPSAAAAEGIAKARDALHDDVKAYAAFSALLRDYGQGLTANLRRYAQSRVTALGKVTGTLNVQVSEAGAHVFVDNIDAGTSPLQAPVRVTPGSHQVRAAKPGYQDASSKGVVVAGNESQVSLTMQLESHTGHVSVHEKGGHPISVYIDGIERGPTPWQGEVEAGEHEIYGRGEGRIAAARPLPVAKGTTTEVELVSAPTTARLTISTGDRKATVLIDGQVVGVGPYDGDVSLGSHVVRVTRDGYEQFEKRIVMVEGHPHTETVNLQSVTEVRTGSGGSAEAMAGGFGGLMGAFVVEPGGLGGDLSSPCAASVMTCSSTTPLGAGLFGYAGYMTKPVGLDALFGVQADSSRSNVTPPGGSPATFAIPRAGGLVALRARLAWQAPEVRLTFAGGVGMAVRVVRLAQDGDITSLFTGGTQESVYVAPAITFEGAMHWRTSSGAAISLGILFWAENAGSGPQMQTGTLPPVHVLGGAQSFVLPFLGLEFGP